MDFKEFKQRANVRTVNTCNGWGFGGFSGKVYELGDMAFYDTKQYYRHSSPTSNISYHIATKKVSKEEFLTTLETLV
jgi:hypothetical protein